MGSGGHGTACLPVLQEVRLLDIERDERVLSQELGGDEHELNELMAVRRSKLAELLAQGIQPYGGSTGGRYERTHETAALLADFESLEGTVVRIAGRIMSIRLHGKASFADLQDSSGRVQLMLKSDVLGDNLYQRFIDLDLGDIIGVQGVLFRTRRGEISVEVRQFELLSKTLRPLPEKWHGLKDVEARYRHRYVDLIVNPSVRKVFATRSIVITAMRQFFVERGFLEVETPMLNVIPGGANARPFVTHHNALDMDLYLRIAPELYLKRLLVGGFERVFEIGKNFRNEGISTKHNPEYTSLEAYMAYADYHDVMDLIENLFAYVAVEATGSTKVEYAGQVIDFTPPWPRVSMTEAIQMHTGIDLSSVTTAEEATARVETAGVHLAPGLPLGSIVAETFEALVEDKFIQPTFITDFPVEVSPLAKRKPSAPHLTDRFELYICGAEVVNGFSELNDPIDQRRRFQKQVEQRQQGDAEAHPMDEDFLRALEFGMPPAGGLGIGIDRLVMFLTDSQSIRDVLLFPHMRPR